MNKDAKLARITTMLEKEEGTGIIYTASVRSANELHEWLTQHGVSAGHYHGKMKLREREQVQQRFMRGDHKVMIATKAFGLGIDKPDIRFVYHYEFPDSLETYYQEAGRAGRDGLPSRAVLLYRLEDKRIQSFFLAGRYPKIAELQAVWETMAGSVLTGRSTELDAIEVVPAIAGAAGGDHTDLSHEPKAAPTSVREAAAKREAINAEVISDRAGVGGRKTQVVLHLLRQAGIIRRGRRGYELAHTHPPSEEALGELLRVYEERAKQDKDRLGEMMRYAETVDCRAQVIRQYFGDDAGERCGRCDNCEHTAIEGAEAGLAARAQADAGEQAEQRATQIAAAAETRRADEAHDGAAVTRVETMHGTIVTTAPETLPQPEDESRRPTLTRGDKVEHQRFGPGTVRDAHGDIALIRFSKGGERKVKLSYLKRTS